MRGADLLRRLAAADAVPPPVCLLTGDDAWLRGKLIAALGRAAVPDAWAGANRETVWAADAAPDAVMDAARTPPFGGPRRAIVVRDVGAWLNKPAGAKRRSRKAAGAGDQAPALFAYLADPSPTTVLVLSWEGGRSGADALAAAVERAGTVVACERPSGEELRMWLAERARDLGLSVDGAATASLLERAAGEPLQLERELEKLASYAGPLGRAGLEDVLEVAGEAAPPDVFHFLDVLFVERAPGRALALLGRLLDEMHPLQLLALLSGQARKLAVLRGALASGATDWQIASRANLPASLVPRLAMVARRTPSARFAELLRAVGAAESSLKQGGDGRTVLEGLVVEVCR